MYVVNDTIIPISNVSTAAIPVSAYNPDFSFTNPGLVDTA